MLGGKAVSLTARAQKQEVSLSPLLTVPQTVLLLCLPIILGLLHHVVHNVVAYHDSGSQGLAGVVQAMPSTRGSSPTTSSSLWWLQTLHGLLLQNSSPWVFHRICILSSLASSKMLVIRFRVLLDIPGHYHLEILNFSHIRKIFFFQIILHS